MNKENNCCKFNNGNYYEISIKTIRKRTGDYFLHRGPNWFALFHNVYVITIPCAFYIPLSPETILTNYL